MSNKKLSDLSEWTTALTDNDLFLILPAAETTQHYKIKKSNLPGNSAVLVTETFAASSTSGNYQSTGATLSATPAGAVMIFIAGLKWELGGDRAKDCYFSSDGGTTAKALGSAASGDTLYWNGTINSGRTTQFLNVLGNLAGGELIEIIY